MANSTYIFGRGYLSATRLNLQHFLWKENLGNDSHPNIPMEHHNTKIADVGTGTGYIWFLSLAKRLPSSFQLNGFDISSKQYPAVLPKNVTLQIADALQNPPSESIGEYDVVHIRLFMGVISDNDPLPLLRHFFAEPGGYIQWEEYDLSAQKVISSQPSSPTKNLAEMSERMQTRWPTSWVKSLLHIFEAQGLEIIAVDTKRLSEWYAKMSTEVDCILRKEFASTVLDQKGPPGSGEELRNQIQATYEEVEQGSCISNLLQVVVGRKAPQA
ncbi:hypothetical protein JMJ35_010218 [Cladonia borealis]|uniref:Methyltransferase n=1 Tax=Cladonia borealis TaxID=184061 RepID=A0AA39V5Z9_9LECA|nr:hypothetical protein JMJ35_010218 [Cladonia borealis]